MPVDFAHSETKKNLLRAFAGESQARNRYTFAAGLARKEKLYVIESLFTFTANQELGHARVFYDRLKPFSGENVAIDGAYPLDLYTTVLEHLRAAQHNEYQEFEHDYTGFAHVAKEEGFPEVSHIFSQIARVEQIHGNRFKQFADLMTEGKLFVSDVECKWMCLNCGYISNSTMAPESCPICRHEQGYFIRVELAPFGAHCLV